MKIINKTGYRSRRISAIVSAVALEVGLTKEWRRGKNYTLEIAYEGDKKRWVYGRYRGSLTIPRYLCPTLHIIHVIYPQVFFSKHLQGTWQPPPTDDSIWDPLIARFGTTQIEYPKLPKEHHK